MVKLSKGVMAGMVNHITRTGGKLVSNAGLALGRGLLPTRAGATVGERAFGLGVKGATAVGLYGASKHVSNSIANSSGPTYTTMLRNNLLNQNIRPQELSSADQEAVRRQGMN